ncbi:MAG: peptidylprolyl isomerase [Hyphomicrobiaceae bacterium]
MTTLFDKTAAGAAGDATARSPLPRPKPVSVNGVVIAHAEIARETQNHPAGKPVAAWLAAARALVVRELLLQEANRLALAPQPLTDPEGRRETDEEALVRQLIAQEVRTPEPDEETCRRIYAANRARFRTSDLYGVRHILLPAAPDDAEARQKAKVDADAILATVHTEPESFARLATAFSACPSAAQGGSLGQISDGQTVPEFESALAELDGHGLIETRYGWHVVVVDQRIAGRELPFEMVHAQVAEWLVTRARHTAIRQYITMLAGRATITGIELAGDASPLVQ